jgi:predicted lipid-binding transport protein (Tim44 family)
MRNTLLRVVPWAALAALVLVTALSWLRQDRDQAPAAAPPQAAEDPAAVSSSDKTQQPSAADDLSAEQLTERAKAQLALSPAAALRDIARADALGDPGAPGTDTQTETRRVIEIHALVRLGKVGEARALTDRFYRAFPDSDRAAELERLTGYHPRPSGP